MSPRRLPELLIQRLKALALPVLTVLIAGLVLLALDHLLAEVDYADLVESIQSADPARLGWAILAALASYLLLMGYDFSALRHVGARVEPRIVAFTSFVAYALGNTVGLGVLTGGAVRFRLYSAAGVDATQIGKAIAFNAAAFGIGLLAVGGVGFLFCADDVAPALHIAPFVARSLAGLIVAMLVVSLAVCFLRQELPLGRLGSLRLPYGPLALGQLLISVGDVLAAGTCLWLLLPSGDVSFAHFMAFYAMALMAGVISHVPGGLGVFEVVMLVCFGGRLPQDQLVAALLLYRGIYYVLPLAVALVMLAVFELRKGVVAPVARAAMHLSPIFLAAMLSFVAVMLLVSGSLPASDDAMELLELNVPLPLVEASHLFSSVAGLLMLFVVRGILHRLDAAWWAALVITGVAAVLALPKGISVPEMLVLGYLMLMLVLSRQEFDRPASLFAQRFTLGWWLLVVCVLALVGWLLFFAYRDVDYAHELWWQFEFDGHAPRSLRAMLALILTGAAIAFRQWFRPHHLMAELPAATDVERAHAIVAGQAHVDACLAMMGDKHFIFSQSGNSFLMFGMRNRSMVALFDPVGDAGEASELVWRFVEAADEAGARAAFYQVTPAALPMYLDAGLRVFKLGEYAWVTLAEFSLKGPRRANLRQGVNRAERQGLSVEVLPLEQVTHCMDILREISDDWLVGNDLSEKGFSLGRFDPAYVARNPVALVRQGERVVAFATLQVTSQRHEVSVDLMRQVQDAPACTMEYLFVQLMLHFQAQGYERFGLGMAPLSGMIEHPLATGWHRFARLLFNYGESFYNFQGLRSFKQKFDPVWEPRYLAASGGLGAIRSSIDVAALISGGLRKAVTR